MNDCDPVAVDVPIRQGDVLKVVRGNSASNLVIVITADCDIANNKFGEAGLACIQLHSLVDYVLYKHARNLAQGQLKKRFAKVAEAINKHWTKKHPNNVPLSIECVRDWILKSSTEEINKELGLSGNERTDLIDECLALQKAQSILNYPKEKYAAIDAMCALQTQPAKRSAQIKTIFGALNPKNLPLDLFYISNIPGETDIGFIADMRALTFISLERSYTSMDDAKDVDHSFVRIGRLGETFRHALAQQFGVLFSRIGMPASWEKDRDVAFEMISEEIKAGMEN